MCICKNSISSFISLNAAKQAPTKVLRWWNDTKPPQMFASFASLHVYWTWNWKPVPMETYWSVTVRSAQLESAAEAEQTHTRTRAGWIATLWVLFRTDACKLSQTTSFTSAFAWKITKKLNYEGRDDMNPTSSRLVVSRGGFCSVHTVDFGIQVLVFRVVFGLSKAVSRNSITLTHSSLALVVGSCRENYGSEWIR